MAEYLGVWLDSVTERYMMESGYKLQYIFFEGSYSAAPLKSSLCLCLDDFWDQPDFAASTVCDALSSDVQHLVFEGVQNGNEHVQQVWHSVRTPTYFHSLLQWTRLHQVFLWAEMFLTQLLSQSPDTLGSVEAWKTRNGEWNRLLPLNSPFT